MTAGEPTLREHLAAAWTVHRMQSPYDRDDPRYSSSLLDVLTHEAELSIAHAVQAYKDSLPIEWGVRFPSGAVQQCDDEAEAKRYALAYNGARPDLPTLVVRKAATGWEIPEDAIEQCGANHPRNDSVVPCVLDKGHPLEEDHFSTTGCTGSEVSWSQLVHMADWIECDSRPLCRHEYAGHEGPCERKPVCGSPPETLAGRDARLHAWLAEVSPGDIVTVRLNSTDTLTGKVYEAPDASQRTALYVNTTLLRHGNGYPGASFEPVGTPVGAPPDQSKQCGICAALGHTSDEHQPQAETDGRPIVERLASEGPDQCPVDGLPCWECPSYCLEVYPPAGGDS